MDRTKFAVALPVELIDRLQATPWKYGFFALMRRINANPVIDPVGKASLPATEPFKVGQKPSLIFAPSEIADARVVNGKLRIRLYSLGMFGPNGPLPLHVTEIAREREELRGDLPIPFEDHVRVHVGVLGALHLVAFASNANALVAHGLGGSNDFATVIGGVTEPDEIDHAGSP